MSAQDPHAGALAVAERLADEALAPWVGVVSAQKLARMRVALLEALVTHPAAAPLVERLAASPIVEKSGEVGGGQDASTTNKRGAAR